MLRKRLGSTDLFIPAIGIGTGDGFWDAPVSRADKIAVLRGGVDAGMNLIDTAEEYGHGISEEIVGEAIDGIRDRVVLCTKFSPQHSSHDDVLRAAENSLKRLRADYIDLYQVHWTNPAVPLEETISALCELVDAGKVRAIGVCNFSDLEIAQVVSLLGGRQLASLQAEYNLFERTLEQSGTLDRCAASGISVLAYSPLDQGRLGSMKSDQRNVLADIARDHSATIAQIVLLWLVSHVSVAALTRTTSLAHAKENAAAMSIELSSAEVGAIDHAFSFDIVHIAPDRIRVVPEGEWNHAVYQTLEEALENRFAYVPSPRDLARSISSGDFLKPVRVVPSSDSGFDYDLIGGRIRYWAWVIARGAHAPIPAYVREGLPSNGA